ncbi:MAG: pilus assembly FimT family protein [Desulfuromonadaceae bacterium]
MNARGFSLIELIVIMALIGILLSIGTLNFNSWSRKYAVEAQVKEMQADVTAVRLRAISTKLSHQVTFNPTSLVVSSLDDAGVATPLPEFNKTFKFPIQQFSSGTISEFADTNIVFNERGYLPDTGLTIAVGIGLADAALNCVAIHTARVNMGRINGNSCDLQ